MSDPTLSRDAPAHRVFWIAGTRGEILALGPAFLQLSRRGDRRCPQHRFALTGEHGMEAMQTLDHLELRAHQSEPICHPADEPAARLNNIMQRVEALVRRHKGDRMIVAGWTATAAAAAVVAHARNTPALWVQPPDPAGLIARLEWEAGLERIIRACAPLVTTYPMSAWPDPPAPGQAPPSIERTHEIPGLRTDAPVILIAVLRRHWGIFSDTTGLLARVATRWAQKEPERDFVVISNLNARLERPIRSRPDRPANLLLAPPLPYPVYRQLLGRTLAVLTDSVLIAGEALRRNIPVAALADRPGRAGDQPLSLMPAQLAEGQADPLFTRGGGQATEPPPIDPAGEIRAVVEQWLHGGPLEVGPPG